MVRGKYVRATNVSQIEIFLLYLASALALFMEFLLGRLTQTVGVQSALYQNIVVTLIFIGLHAVLATSVFT